MCPAKAEVEALEKRREAYLKDARLPDFHMLNTVGTGTFGRVRLCKHLASGDVYAIKSMRKAEVIRLKQEEHINSERTLLSELRHPFIVTMFKTFQDKDSIYMLLEFVPGGEIFSHLRQAGRFSKEYTKFYAAQIVLVLEYLHAKNVVYRDLKPENLLISPSGYLKITDFGFAKVVEDQTWTLCGTPEYLAPEIIQRKGHSKGVDWWATGILMFEMMCGYPPYYDETPFGVYQKVLVGKIEFPKHMDDYSKDIVKRLLIPDKLQRLGCIGEGAEDIKRHKFFRGVDFPVLARRRIVPPIVPKMASAVDTHYFEAYPEDDETVFGTKGPPRELTAAEQAGFKDF